MSTICFVQCNGRIHYKSCRWSIYWSLHIRQCFSCRNKLHVHYMQWDLSTLRVEITLSEKSTRNLWENLSAMFGIDFVENFSEKVCIRYCFKESGYLGNVPTRKKMKTPFSNASNKFRLLNFFIFKIKPSLFERAFKSLIR